jgi:hypothetical protein
MLENIFLCFLIFFCKARIKKILTMPVKTDLINMIQQD